GVLPKPLAGTFTTQVMNVRIQQLSYTSCLKQHLLAICSNSLYVSGLNTNRDGCCPRRRAALGRQQPVATD
ncbi:unnamed protein product, partial [marine sediment metagenome]